MQAPRDTNLPACFSLPRVEYGALVCSKPEAHFVLDTDGRQEHVLENEEELDNQNEALELEMVAVSYPPNLFTELSSHIYVRRALYTLE